MIARTLTQVAGIALLGLLAAVVILAASLIRETAEGFCPQLDPCHTEETQP